MTAIANAALLSWPLITIILFLTLPRAHALAWSLICGYLLLPNRVGFDFPFVPTLDKERIPILAAAVAVALGLSGVRRPSLRGAGDAPPPEDLGGWLPRSPTAILLLAVVLFGPILTGLTNTDGIQLASGRVIRGMTLRDTLSAVVRQAIFILPFLMGRRLLFSDDHHRALLRILVLAGLGYSLLALYEVRMSPQLHTTIYGFFQHSFAQTVRGGGFRPVVFLNNGLRLAIFVAVCAAAAAALFRCSDGPRRAGALAATLWLGATLVLCKSLGALILAVAFVPVILFFGKGVQMLSALAASILLLTYPMLRGSGLLNQERILAPIEIIDPRRVSSLRFRLRNEDVLLDRANDRPLFGWSGFGRARVYDDVTGKDISVTDGIWIITIGENGWLGYIGLFGLIALPIFILYRHRGDMKLTLATTGLCVVLALSFVDMLPNAGLTPVVLMISGALLGRAEKVSEESRQAVEEARRRRREERRGVSAIPTAAPGVTP